MELRNNRANLGLLLDEVAMTRLKFILNHPKVAFLQICQFIRLSVYGLEIFLDAEPIGESTYWSRPATLAKQFDMDLDVARIWVRPYFHGTSMIGLNYRKSSPSSPASSWGLPRFARQVGGIPPGWH